MTDTQLLQAIYGDLQSVKSEVAQLRSDVSAMNGEIKGLRQDVSDLKVDVAELKEDVAALKIDVADLKTRVSALETDSAAMKVDIAFLKEETLAMKSDIASLKAQTRKNTEMLELLKVILDMETNRNIKIIAEGHLDLSRKLDTAIQMSSEVHAEQEIYKILVNRHERQLNATA